MDSDLISESFEDMSDRELARKLEVSESQVRDLRKDQGFLRLDEFDDSDDVVDSPLDLCFELDEMHRRKMQGFVGEKLCHLMKSKVIEHLEDHIKDNWLLVDKAEIVSEEGLRHISTSRYYNEEDIEVEGDTVKHFDASEEEIRSKVEKNCFKVDAKLLKAFHKVRNPWIDFSFYAFKIEDKMEHSFDVRDYSENSLQSSETLKVDVPKVEDFKIVALEVKTTKGNEDNLLSKNQRKVRNIAEDSPFLDFFTLKVDSEFEELCIPESFDAVFRKHS